MEFGAVIMSRNNHPQNRRSQQELSHREVSVSTTEYHHSGPIPDPITLERYEQILPGSADRILKMAEDQTEHRQDIERTVIRSRSRDSLLGVISGFILASLTIVSGTYAVIKGYQWSGAFLGTTGLVGVVSVFVYGTRSARKERASNK